MACSVPKGKQPLLHLHRGLGPVGKTSTLQCSSPMEARRAGPILRTMPMPSRLENGLWRSGRSGVLWHLCRGWWRMQLSGLRRRLGNGRWYMDLELLSFSRAPDCDGGFFRPPNLSLISASSSTYCSTHPGWWLCIASQPFRDGDGDGWKSRCLNWLPTEREEDPSWSRSGSCSARRPRRQDGVLHTKAASDPSSPTGSTRRQG